MPKFCSNKKGSSFGLTVYKTQPALDYKLSTVNNDGSLLSATHRGIGVAVRLSVQYGPFIVLFLSLCDRPIKFDKKSVDYDYDYMDYDLWIMSAYLYFSTLLVCSVSSYQVSCINVYV